MPDVTTLPADRHAIYRLANGLLLVFKPRGHREPSHAHAYAQRLRVLSGTLAVERGDRTDLVTPDGGVLAIAAHERHATQAHEDVWVVVDSSHGRP